MASDHAGFALKEQIKDYLCLGNYTIHDFGCFNEERVDYPDFIYQAALAVSHGEYERAVVFCGSGVGASIVANKVPGIRAVLCFSEYIAEYSRLHNDTNVLVLPGRLVTIDNAKRFTHIWLKAPFEKGRHQERLDKITEIEKITHGG
jgi:ribose 5-phosphate isomerase B